MDFTIPADHSDNQSKRKDVQVFGSRQREEKAVEHEDDVIPIVIGALRLFQAHQSQFCLEKKPGKEAWKRD